MEAITAPTSVPRTLNTVTCWAALCQGCRQVSRHRARLPREHRLHKEGLGGGGQDPLLRPRPLSSGWIQALGSVSPLGLAPGPARLQAQPCKAAMPLITCALQPPCPCGWPSCLTPRAWLHHRKAGHEWPWALGGQAAMTKPSRQGPPRATSSRPHPAIPPPELPGSPPLLAVCVSGRQAPQLWPGPTGARFPVDYQLKHQTTNLAKVVGGIRAHRP